MMFTPSLLADKMKIEAATLIAAANTRCEIEMAADFFAITAKVELAVHLEKHGNVAIARTVYIKAVKDLAHHEKGLRYQTGFSMFRFRALRKTRGERT